MKKFWFAGLLAVAAMASGCGDQTPPAGERPPADVPQARPEPVAPPKQECTAPPKQCEGGAAPTIDPATCAQTCPGE